MRWGMCTGKTPEWTVVEVGHHKVYSLSLFRGRVVQAAS